jgi:hypothetical protein
LRNFSGNFGRATLRNFSASGGQLFGQLCATFPATSGGQLCATFQATSGGQLFRQLCETSQTTLRNFSGNFNSSIGSSVYLQCSFNKSFYYYFVFIDIDFHFKRNPENQTAVNGSRVEIICEPPDHFPINAIQYSWYKAYRRISVNGRVRISSGNLVISPVLKSDEDVYFCEVSLPKTFLMKTRASTPAYLTVNGKVYVVDVSV